MSAPISTADTVRIALAPLHVIIGGVLVERFVTSVRTPMVLVLGLGFMAFGVYKLVLIRRAWRSR